VTSVNELCDAVEKTRPDVVLLSVDSAQNSMAVLGVVTDIHARHPATRVILLLDSNHRELIIEAFRSGVRGVSIRTEKAATLSKAIRSVHSGQIWANTEQLHYLLEAFKATAPLRIVNVKGQTLLSERQRQLVTLVIEGLTNREIADRLHLSEHTVKNYLFRIFDKLGVSTRTELILYALSQQKSESTGPQDAAA
jgi:DNA-binding NarL/FixJ family response regulator